MMVALVAFLVAKIAMVAKLLWWQWRDRRGSEGAKTPCRAKLLSCGKTSGLCRKFNMVVYLYLIAIF